MGWSIGYDENWKRDIGYGVPAECDHPRCNEQIDRGLSYLCDDEHGCGLYFCEEHLDYHERRVANGEMESVQLCPKCSRYDKKAYNPKEDVTEWILHKLADESWATWRLDNPKIVKEMKKRLKT